MSNEDNIPNRLLNHFDTPKEDESKTSDIFTQVVISVLIDMPESDFKWDEKRQVYVCMVAGKELELRKTSYRGLQYLKKKKKGYL